MRLLDESIKPLEGFFWFINNEIIGIAKEVPQYGYEYKQSKTHEEAWELFKKDYKINNKEVSFNYFPRGRVMVDPEYEDNKFKYYSAMIFLDPCIDNNIIKEKIISYYNLYNVKQINWFGNLKQRAGINHYSCNNCRIKENN